MPARVLQRMMGLTSSTYWLVNWFFWSLMYMTYLGVLDLMTILMRLPNGFRVGWFIQSETTLVLVFFILVSQHTTAFAFLISAVWGSYKGSQKLAFGFSVALYVLLPQIIQQLVSGLTEILYGVLSLTQDHIQLHTAERLLLCSSNKAECF